ncbi:MAG: mechanosensitive ion channel [Bacteroidales bacterium]
MDIHYFFDLVTFPVITVVGIVVLLVLNKIIFNTFTSVAVNVSLVKKSVSFVIVLVGILIFIFSLPVDKSIKGEIISFLAVIISAGIALSSTTLLGNLIAGIMNNSMERFRNGDLIKIGDFHGRVTKKSVFHTEMQLEDSNLMTIPNLYIVSHPVKLTRKNNTVVSATISLGYNVSRLTIEKLLKEAAQKAGLSDPYVYITELGDYSVVYKIHGFLENSTTFFSSGSLLNACVMDVLHEHEIEIVSPSFMNQRRVDDETFIATHDVKNVQNQEKDVSPEELIFDEAIQSEKIEKKKEFLETLDAKYAELKAEIKKTKDSEKTARLKAAIERVENVQKKLAENIFEAEHKKEK